MLELLVAVGLILLSRITISDIISVSSLAKGLISRIGEKDAFGILKKAIDKTAREAEEAKIKEILGSLKGKEDLLREFRVVDEEAKGELVSKYFKGRSDVLEHLAKNYYELFCKEAIKKDRPFREFVVIELGKLANQGVITDDAVKTVESHIEGVIEELKREKEAASRQFLVTGDHLEERLERIKDFCSRNLSYIHSLGLFKHYTNHGPAHSEAVIKLLEKLTESCELSEYESFILKSAAWCHDLGMLKMDDEALKFDDPEVCEKVRKEHHKRTVKYIQKHREELGLRETESIILEWICYAHSSKVDIKKVKEEYTLTIDGRDENVRARFLSALLRIADALDAKEDRLPPEGYMNIPGIPEASYREYWKHKVVKEVDIRGGEIIIGTVEKYEYPEGVNVVAEVKEKLTEELNSVKDVLEARGLKFDMKFRVFEAPVKKELPVAAERRVKAHAVVNSEDELKGVLKNPDFIETPFWKGFSSWEDFKSTVYDAFYKFIEILEGQIAVVYGDMGIGKTTYMLWLVRKLIEGEEEVIFLNAYEIESALREVKHELNKFFVIDALGRALKHGESASAFEKRCKDIIKFANENRAKFIITMRTHEKDIFYNVVRREGYEFIDIGPERIKPCEEDMYCIIANHLKYFKVSIAGFRPERAYELIYSDNFRGYEELFDAVEMLMDKSTGAPFYIRHAISEFEGRRMRLRDIEKLPRGVENLVMMTVESFLKGDDSDKNFIKVLIAISKLRDFSYDFYEAICGEIGEDEERRNAFERFLLRSDYRRYALPSYWKESVDKAIERNIENMELVGKFRDANEDFPSVKEFLRTKLMDWINKASNNRKKLCGLLADAARNAPILGVDLLYFANQHFEKEWGEKECEFTLIILAAEFFYLGHALCESERFNESISAYKNSIDLIPLAIAYYNRGGAYGNLNQHERAIEDYNKAIDSNPNLAEAYTNRGNAYVRLNQYEWAIEDYNKAIELNPNFAEAYTNRGSAYVGLNQHERAIEDYSKAIELNPNLAWAYYNRGTAYAGLNQHERAIEDYNKAIELNPNFAWAYNNRGNAYAKSNQHERAIEDYNKAIELNPNFAEAYNNRGLAYVKLNQLERAIADYSKAIELNPNFAEAYNNRGTAYAGLNQHERAIEDYNKAIELNPNFAEAYNNRGSAYVRLNQHERAIEDYNKAIELNPNYAEAYNNRGSAYAQLNQYLRGIEDYNKAIELNPDDAKAYGNRGKAHSEIGRYKESARDFKKAEILFFDSGSEEDSVKAFSFCFDLRPKIENDDVIYSGLALFLITLDSDIIIELKRMRIEDETIRKIFELTLMKLRDEDISEGIAMLEEKEQTEEMKILLELLRNL